VTFVLDVAWSAPSLLPIGVANTLGKTVRRGAFAAEAATEAVERLPRRPIRDVDTVDLAAAFALATRRDHPVHDGCDLADAEDGRVVTADRRLLARVHDTGLAARGVARDALVAAQG
jgi:predicted nucleic acid-binding protein